MKTEALTQNFFVYYRPKDIISGDFYYALSHKPAGKKSEIFYMCTADCTGHGVPGALMSILGISHLKEAIVEKGLVHPHDILNDVRSGIIRSLNPEGSDEQSRDGMDCVLCAYDFDAMTLEFAAANNPLWHVRGGQLSEYKPDKMPVGWQKEEPAPFKLQSLKLQEGDVVYTFSDGYADQFGGERGKKYKYARFKELFLSMHQESMNVQHEGISTEFEKWKGDFEQIDDVCVIGVRV